MSLATPALITWEADLRLTQSVIKMSIDDFHIYINKNISINVEQD